MWIASSYSYVGLVQFLLLLASSPTVTMINKTAYKTEVLLTREKLDSISGARVGFILLSHPDEVVRLFKTAQFAA